VDDDCDAGTPDSGGVTCDGLLASNSTDALDYARAIDLCSFTAEDAPLAEKRWGVIDAAFALADGTGTPAANARSIRASFGSGVGPQGGARVAVLSSGRAAAQFQVNPAWVNPQNPGADMTTTSPVPADWLAAHDGVPPVIRRCPSAAGGTTAFDPIQLRLRVRVPTNARSFSLRAFVYVSDYPEYTCSPYVDYFLALLDSQFVARRGQYPNPADKNLAVHDPAPARRGRAYPVGGNLAALDRGLFRQCKNGPVGCASGSEPGAITTCVDTTELVGTGFDIENPTSPSSFEPAFCEGNNLLGGGTGWLTLRGNVEPGETMELRLTIWDTGDHLYDSVVLLDDFRWSVETAVPGAHP
jgi:hypothetical protein